MVDWRGYARFVGKWYGTLLACLWLLVAGLLLAGFVVGPAPTDTADAPEVDTSDPPSEVAADAVAELRVRDHTVERWYRKVNTTSGERRGGIAYRVRVDHDDREVRVHTYPEVYYEGITRPSDARYEFYGTTAVRWQRAAPGGHWRRTPRHGYVYEHYPSEVTDFEDAFRGAEAVVVAENVSKLVIRVTDEETLDAHFASPNATQRRLVVVVDKRPEPHLARITYTARGPDYRQRSTYDVSEVGTTDARRPGRAVPPWATHGAIRSLAGLERIGSWLGQ